MAMHLEFVVLGPPISNQVRGPNLTAWRATIAGAATLQWPNALLTGELKAIIVNFYTGGRPSLDLDNMSKPILDEMEGIVYNNDRQVVQAELTHVQIGAAFSIVGVRPILVSAIQTGNQFVYVRIDDALYPFQLSR
jgi:Holliday junction resolvase RusA-like endonuclease